MQREITDARSFWSALSLRATSVAIVTAAGESGPSGFLALSAAHFTPSPPTMTVSVSLTTSAYVDIVESQHFAINYLSKDAVDVYQRFSARDAPKGTERFSSLAYKSGKSGAPIFSAITGALECKVEEIIKRHGTALVIGTIILAHDNEAKLPMVHYRGAIIE